MRVNEGGQGGEDNEMWWRKECQWGSPCLVDLLIGELMHGNIKIEKVHSELGTYEFLCICIPWGKIIIFLKIFQLSKNIC